MGNINDYLPLSLIGTTFSGDPTSTTLGNTLRCLAYLFYYAWKSGELNITFDDDKFTIHNPEKMFIMATGDDGNIYSLREVLKRIKEFMMTQTSRDVDLPSPLG